MGQEIVYCYKCQRRIVGAEFTKGQAFQVGNHVTCSSCAADLLQTLNHGEREQLLAKMFKATQDRGAHATGAPPLKQPSVRLPPSPGAPAPRPAAPVVPIAVGAVVLISVVLAVVLTRGPSENPTAPVVVDRRPPPPPVEDPRRKLQETIASDFSAIDAELRTLEAREAFQAALSFLATARGRHLVPEWTQGIDARVRRVNDAADKLFAGLQADAVAARKNGAEDKELSARVEKWGMPRYVDKLQQALAAAPKPAPAAPPPPPPPPATGVPSTLNCDFSSPAVVYPLWTIQGGDFAYTFSGMAEFKLAPTTGTLKATQLVSHAKFLPPFRISADVEITRRAKALVCVRLQSFKEARVVKLLHADAGDKYTFYTNDGQGVGGDPPGPAGQREQWTIDVEADGNAVWSINGKEHWRLKGIQSESGFFVFIRVVGANGIEADARVRFRNLSVEPLKR